MRTERMRNAIGKLVAALVILSSLAFDARGSEQAPQWVSQSSPKKADVAVVFVHGILGDTLSTWTNANGMTFFRLLKDNPDVGPKVDIFAFGFSSRMLGGGSLDIPQAATKLDELLEYYGVWSYRRVVFVTHSMGGLITMRSLAIRPIKRAKVPLMVFFAVPQEGVQIAEIGSKFISNPALQDLARMDGNTFLRVLDEDWRQLGESIPYVACAYETSAYLGSTIVPFASSTRICKGNTLAVERADHLSIVKPDSPTHGSVIFLVNRLKERVFNASNTKAFLTPDFIESGDQLVFKLPRQLDPTTARLINNTDAPLTYLLSQFSDRHLYYWPADTPRDISPRRAAELRFAVPLGEAKSYSFVLTVVGAAEKRVTVEMLPEAVPSTKKASLTGVAAGAMSDFAKGAPSNAKPEQLVQVAASSLRRQLKMFPAGDQAIVVAEVLFQLNLPELASIALKSASTNAPQAVDLRSALEPSALTRAPIDRSALASTYLRDSDAEVYEQLADNLKRVPAFRGYAFSLAGDIAYAKGESVAAKASYTESVRVSKSTLVEAKLASIDALATKTVLIGVGTPLSGPIAYLGRDNELGARLAIDALNSKGLILDGRVAEFRVLAEDDSGDPVQGAAAARKLVEAKVNGVIGHLNSGTLIPASQVYSAAGIPQISPSATNPKYTRQGFKTTFRIVADDVHLGGTTLGKYAVVDLKGKAIAVIDDRTAYGQGVADEFEKAVTAAGGKTLDRQFTTDKATDFTAILTQIKAKKADVIFFGGMDNVAGPLIRQMKQLGINAKFVGGDGICSSELPKLAAGTMADGQVICAEAGGVGGESNNSRDAFRAAFKTKFDVEPQYYAPYSFDAVNVMAAAMVKAGSAEPAKYLPDLANTSGYKGLTGTIAFDGKGDIKNQALTFFTYKAGIRTQIEVIR